MSLCAVSWHKAPVSQNPVKYSAELFLFHFPKTEQNPSSSFFGHPLRLVFPTHTNSRRRRITLKKLLQILALLAVLTSTLSATRAWADGAQPWPKQFTSAPSGCQSLFFATLVA